MRHDRKIRRAPTGDGETVRMSMLDAGPNLSSDEGTSGGISMAFLAENGF